MNLHVVNNKIVIVYLFELIYIKLQANHEQTYFRIFAYMEPLCMDLSILPY